MFLSVFLGRRILFVLILIYLNDYLGLQLCLHLILNLAYMGYFAVVKPYSQKDQNEWEIFNEVCVMIVTYILLFLTLFD